jgi:CRISPR/Cas system-associated exonuclease Cas4 (RecB family)
MTNLSKSKILAYLQCPKRLWLEIHRAELRDDSASEMVFQIGNQVGEMARQIYDPENSGSFIDIQELGHKEALAQSAVLLAEGKSKVFEAGVTIKGALAYADVMLPDHSDGTLRWKMIEVKSSTSVKDYHRDDIAVQAHIAAEAGVRLTSVSLAHIDNSFVYSGDGNYQGLLKENDLTEEAISRTDEAREWIAAAQAIAALTEEPEVATGPHCNTPFDCGFCAYCNLDKVFPEYPLSSLPRLHYRKREQLEAAGHEDLRDVPDEFLGEVQNRVKQCSITGETYFDAAGAAADLAPYGFPAYFLDFETTMFAVPIWKGTRPYQQLPFQFSLHILTESGDLQHHGFLDLSGDDPSRACAQALVDLCGEQGPVFAYNASFECRVMRELAARFPEFAAGLEGIIDRVVDLLPIARNRYYHPSQHGSWSIKAVLPAMCPDLSYDSLEGVQDGGMAQVVHQEAIAPETTPDRKEEIRKQLHEYCKLDTFAMVRIYQFFRGS